jgi:hypothetical protein
MWEEFLEKHATWDLINPDIGARFNEAKAFKVSAKTLLHREFFKHLGHFSDEDLKVFVMHLLGKTLNRSACMPKVLVYKPQKVHPGHYTAPDWVERRKKKMIVLQELVAINPGLQFIKMDGSIDNSKWREWKCDHGVSSVSYNILLNRPPKGFWLVRLPTKGS